MGETSIVKHRLGAFCTGIGLDVGFGGDPITRSAITIDINASTDANIIGDARNLQWFTDESMDYVYSSHLIEDFTKDEIPVLLSEWFRVLKTGGLMVLYLPVQQAYLDHCRKHGLEPNALHKNADFSLPFMKEILSRCFAGRYEIVHEAELVEACSFDLVLKKVKEE